MQILCKGRGILLAQVMGNATDSQIHLTQPPGFLNAFLANYRNTLAISVMTLNKFMGLDKHTARTTARVINYTAVRFDYFRNQLNNASRGVKFTIFFSSGSGVNL
ncbi:hypothetical protein D3C76_1710570 [compost metagenome]